MTDCMCDLIPEGSYRLNVKTLPEDDLTDSPYSTIVTKHIDVPGNLVETTVEHNLLKFIEMSNVNTVQQFASIKPVERKLTIFVFVFVCHQADGL